jgi:uncharacterized protein (TIGR02217 family)
MASFHEVQFPTNISYGSRGGPRFSTEIIKKRSGSEERVARWGYPMHVYNVRYGLRSYEDLQAVKDFFIKRLGPAHGFRYRDPTDFTTMANPSLPTDFRNGSTPVFSDVVIANGDGSTKTFQLLKKYSDAVVTRTRNIYKPVTGTVKSGVNGAEKAITTDWTVDVTTGLLTYGTAPPNGQSVTAGFEFDVPVRFDDSLDEGMILNLQQFAAGDFPDLPLVEEFAPSVTSDEYFYGGAADLAFSVDITISSLTGRFVRLNPAGPSLSVKLPDAIDLEDGGTWFFLANISSNALAIKNSGGTTVFTLNANTGAELLLGTFGGVKTWYGF